MDKELVCRSIINIVDVRRCSEYVKFYSDDICNIVRQYMIDAIIKDKDQAIKDIDACIEKHRGFLERVVQDKEYKYVELKALRESMMEIKHKYYM